MIRKVEAGFPKKIMLKQKGASKTKGGTGFPIPPS
jgi:hypothetical protein